MYADFMTAERAVAIGFLLFIALIVYLKVPQKIAGMLDARADGIRRQLDEAREARESAQKLLASIERKQREAERDAEEVVTRAREDARRIAEEGRAEIERSIARKLRAAEDRIHQAEADAKRDIRNTAVEAAIAATAQAMQEGFDDGKRKALVDDGIAAVGRTLN